MTAVSDKARILVRIFKLLASKAFLIWLFGGWLLFYTVSFVWMKEAFAFFVEGLRNNMLMQIPFLLFLFTAALNTLRRGRTALREGGISRCVMATMLPAGIIIFLAGFFISAATRQAQWIITGDGRTFKPPWSRYTFMVTKVESGIPDILTDGSDSTASGVFQYEPKIFLKSDSSSTTEVGAFPPARAEDAYFGILDFGLAPGIKLIKDGEAVADGVMALRILTPGSSDSFEIPPYPYRFTLSLEATDTRQRSGQTFREYDLRHPAYSIRVYKGDQLVGQNSGANRVDFEGLTMLLDKPDYWFRINAVKDHGLPFVAAGIALMLTGCILSGGMIVVTLVRKSAKVRRVENAA